MMDPRTKESRGFGFVDYEAAQVKVPGTLSCLKPLAAAEKH